ncbi:Jun-like transcription factor,Basic-leucine zipper domain,Transcription factor Jun [Cinara cedri]|uniref:Jun-like transcription factor,Basic-leucine zipper domain,Transcription factor Jun n=1 Tax=Cinara cedri TaxID=506608 RepID=A0A5E4M8H1_9HEMI|nr:Jun-like transcription factor,Basic-leucine zipper domain,Transcription factor Jun [Cinara cedri]
MVNNSSNSMMLDEAFYDDQVQVMSKAESQTAEVHHYLKRPMTLDLNSCNSENSAKKPKYLAPLLTSPDLHMLKMSSPELERFYLAQQSALGHINTPTPSLFPKSVTEEQEMYVQPFVEALNSLHNNDSNSGTALQVKPGAFSGGSNSSEYQSSEPQYSNLMSTSNDFSNIIPQHVIKEEPAQTVPSVTSSSPPMSPINMESQEKIKLERKRQRNRLAASKCRRRKLERIAKLEDKVKELKNENSELSTVLNRLLEQICQLKQTVVEHMHNGCEFAMNCL